MFNNPQPSMRGSGIYSYWTTIEVTCERETCDYSGETECSVNDWGDISFDCPKCDLTQELDKPF